MTAELMVDDTDASDTLLWVLQSKPDWVTSVEPSAGDSIGAVTVTVDRSSLAAGPYQGEVEVGYFGRHGMVETVSLAVSMTVATAG